ncbi:MAG: serine hydrolase domain-containing protein [Gemmatimonadaceae bacterium]
MIRATALVRLACVLLALAPPVGAQRANRAAAIAAIDSLVAANLKDGRAAGMSVGVVRGNDTLVLKAYGKADLELDVPTPQGAVYEIGSVTKQFTAAAMLLLVEEGKLSLDDDLTKHLPDYPTAGNTIPLRRLLDHTSGIKGYTELPKFQQIMTRKLPKDSLVAIFKDQPFDFPTGQGLIYNNSAYFLVGMIIEKVAGMPYGDFVRKRLFEPLGMRDSHYCNERQIVKNRAHGYDMSPAGLMLKGYLDHTYPYSAGSLCSTAGDLVTWLRGLHGGKVLPDRSYHLLVTPEPLADGAKVRYAKGLGIYSLGGHRAIEHGGGINGYLSSTIWLPDEKLGVVVLVNTAGPVSPDNIAVSIVDIVLGRKPEAAGVPLTSDVAPYTGTYEGPGRGARLTMTFVSDSGYLATQGQGAPNVSRLRYMGNDAFVRGREIFTFVRDSDKVVSVRVDRVYQNTVLTKRPN